MDTLGDIFDTVYNQEDEKKSEKKELFLPSFSKLNKTCAISIKKHIVRTILSVITKRNFHKKRIPQHHVITMIDFDGFPEYVHFSNTELAEMRNYSIEEGYIVLGGYILSIPHNRAVPITLITNDYTKQIDQKKFVEQSKFPFCHTCKVGVEKVRKCPICLFTTYCSRECQKKDWGKHKKYCRKIPKL